MATMTVMFECAAADSGRVMQALAPVMPTLQNFSMECRERQKTRKVVSRPSRTKDAVRTVLEKTGGGVKVGTGRALRRSGAEQKQCQPHYQCHAR